MARQYVGDLSHGMRRGYRGTLFLTGALGLLLLLATVAPARPVLDGTTESGVFQIAGATASLTETPAGAWELRFSLPPGGAAGLWTKSLTPDRLSLRPHALRYRLSLAGTSAPVLPVAWEIKGTAGTQRIPVALRTGTRQGEVPLDWGKIGDWSEGVLAVAHPGGKETCTGVIVLDAGLVRWPAWRVILAHAWGRWLGLVPVALLALALALPLWRRGLAGTEAEPGPAFQAGRRRALGFGGAITLAVVALTALLGNADTRPGQWPLTPLAVVLAGAITAGLFTRLWARRWPTPGEALRHVVIPGLPVLAAADLPVWTMTASWDELLRLSRLGAAVFFAAYHAANAYRLVTTHKPLSATAGFRFVATPFLFGLLLVLPNDDLLRSMCAVILPGGIVPCPWLTVWLARALILVVFNVGAALACLGSIRLLKQHPTEFILLPVLALAVSLSPWVADLGSGALALPTAVQPLATLLFTMLSQGALWAEAYALTGLLLQATRIGGRHDVTIAADATQGFRKALSFSGWFMGLLLAGALIGGSRGWGWATGHAPILTWALLGALVFPLVKTVMETFDGSPSFIRRLAGNYRRTALPWRGAVVAGGLAWAWTQRAIEWPLAERAGFGFAVGLAAYAGISVLRDLGLRAAGRGRVAGLRLYAVEALLGGAVGAALGFYLDAAQTPVITRKLAQYLQVGVAPTPYEVYPLLSRWGFLPLGDFTGGARLLWNEALAGVISWGVAAWLFALNRSALLAVLKREWEPLRRAFSRSGVTELAEGTIYVLRWGLWMAPIIFTFLRQMPTPTWYNQDGAIRTLCCIWQSLWLDPQAFEAWSLKVFLGVLAYDAFRVLIWLDHMGLRVATLVNLSFVGMEQLDARVARFLGPLATARCFPEGIKRFTTWAPLLLPFYIPGGAAWDQVWTQSQALRQASPSALERLWAQTPAAGTLELAGVFLAATLFAALASRRRERPRPLALHNKVYAFAVMPDGGSRARLLATSVELHRPSYERLDPSGRALFLAEDVAAGTPESWPVFGNFPAEIGPATAWTGDGHVLAGRHRARGLETEIQVTLPDPLAAVEAWTLTVRNPGDQSRSVLVVPYVEWLLNTTEADRGHTQYNRLFTEVAVLADRAALVASHRLSRTAGFLALDRAPAGLQLARVDFIGRAGTLWAPDALRTAQWRPAHSFGTRPVFDAAAALAVRVELPPGGEQVVRLWLGMAASRAEAESLARAWAPAVSLEPAPQPLRLAHGAVPPGGAGGYARFEQQGRVMRVATPFTPRPFDHTLSNALGHVMSVTQRGLHTSANVNSQQNRLTPDWADVVTREMPGEAFYLFEPATGEWFAPTFEPLRDRRARHDVDFGVDGTAVFRMQRETLSTTLTTFVPPDEPLGVYRLVVRNESDRPRRLVCAACFQMVLAERPEHAGPLQGGVMAGGRGLWFANPRNTFRSGPAFAAMTPAAEARTTRRGDFFGNGRTPAHPAWVEMADSVFGRKGAGPANEDAVPVAGLRVTLELPARGEREVIVILGQAATLGEAERLIARYADPAHARAQLEATRRWWQAYDATLAVETSDPALDGFLHWLKYQALAERIWARKGFYQASGAFGYRDQLQDAVNLTWVNPALARAQILLHAAQQFIEGDAVHWFFRQQDGRTGFACRSHATDNLLWLGWAVADYVRMTGDTALLAERVSYLDSELPFLPLPAGRVGMGFFPLRSPVVETVYDHVRRALDLVIDRRLGPHGLPLIGTGDWNDSFDEIGVEGRGESVWLGCFLLYVLRGMMPHLEARGQAPRYRRAMEALRAALEATWRGDRYLRAIHDDGTEIGKAGGGAWETDALTAAWAVMAGLDEGRARAAFDTALTLLEREDVILLGWPPVLETTRPRFGRVSHYPPGVRENGMYCHGVQWLVGAARVLAERSAAGGDAGAAARYRDTATRLWRKIAPLSHVTPDRIETYGGQPNKQAADMLTEGEPGRMIWSGYTGAAGWMLRQALEGVIGARLENNHVTLPADMHEPRGDLRVRQVIRRSDNI